MAKSNAVWGIDIGQCALKAIRCRPTDDPHVITADAFDFIEYPKILSQPEADPAELVRDALQLFLTRNLVRGDWVAISVSGQTGLARFIKLPPVESKKIPDIVKYEARQQIPFALDDVVWDYQRMAGGSEEEGFALETEVGLFAMKRDQVYRALKPFDEAGIEVDIVQLTPLTIYNFTVFDQMQHLPPPEEYDPENPPESVVVLSLGTDTTDLVITNGYRVWQRSVPIGGNHFTKALSKELRLTFAKAEHLKRNATQADDPKAVFQAMRPVFNDLLTEIQRSIGYFTGIDRRAKIGRVIALGNAMRLPGLQKYLAQNLGYPVSEVGEYRGLSGSAVTMAPAFKENLLSFAVSYGLALQGLGKAKLSTNLLPREIVTDRLIRDKKPWATAAVAALLLGFCVSFLGYWRAWKSVSADKFAPAFSEADRVVSDAQRQEQAYGESQKALTQITEIGERLVGNVDGRLLWLELMKAISAALPSDPVEQRPADVELRNEIHLTQLECEHFADLSTWYAGVAQYFAESGSQAGAVGGGAVPAPGTPPQPGGAPPGAPAQVPQPAGGGPPPTEGGPPPAGGAAPGVAGPTGEGWVIQLTGYHLHNKQREGAQYVRDTLKKNLEEGSVDLPVGPKHELVAVKLKDLGIGFPVLVYRSQLESVQIPDPNADDSSEKAAGGAASNAKMITVRRFNFILQFCWQPTPLSKRLKKEEEEKAKAATGTEVAADGAATRSN